MDRSVLARKPVAELREIASHLEMKGFQKLRKQDLIDAIIGAAGSNGDTPLPGIDDRSKARKMTPPSSEEEAASERPASDKSGDADDDRGGSTRTRRRARSGSGKADGQSGGEDPSSAEVRDADQKGSGPKSGSDRSSDDDGERAARSGRKDQSGRDKDDKAPSQNKRDENKRDQNKRNQQRNDQGSGDSDRGDASKSRGGGDQNKGRQSEGQHDRGQQTSTKGEGGGSNDRSGSSDDNDTDDDQRSRRSRRDRRKRNRDRNDSDDQQPGEVRAGVLDVLPEGYGFLRTTGYLPGSLDVYVSQGQIRKHDLRPGDVVQGPIRQQRSNEKVPALHTVEKVNGEDLVDNRVPDRPAFTDLTPTFPDERLRLAAAPDGEDVPVAMRMMDLLTPVGKGQRGLIAAPHSSGKTTLLTQMTQALAVSSPDCHLMVLLIDERPEEVTQMQRTTPGEVIASTFDRAAEDHTQIAELALERAKRLVELGYDVVLLVDSLTALARAYNLTAPANGRTMATGLDATAQQAPKRFFGAARNIEEGGSLTIIATALIETGSAVDQAVYEELVGTPNMELRLDRDLVRTGSYPAIDGISSRTRKPELILDDEEMEGFSAIRGWIEASESPDAAHTALSAQLERTSDDRELLEMARKGELR